MMAVGYVHPNQGVFFIHHVPMVFFVCGAGEGVRYAIELGGGVICDSYKDAQIIIFNRDTPEQYLRPISLEEQMILEGVGENGNTMKPVLSSFWIYKCGREKILVPELGYTIESHIHFRPATRIAQPSTSKSSNNENRQPSAQYPPTPVTAGSFFQSTPSYRQNTSPIQSQSVNGNSAKRSGPITSGVGRLTNNSLESRLSQNDMQVVSRTPLPMNPNRAVRTYETSTEQAQIILAEELYRFAHKKARISKDDIRGFIKQLGLTRKERSWARSHSRYHEAVDPLVQRKGLDTTDWHDYPSNPQFSLNHKMVDNPVVDIGKKQAKGWAWVSVEDEGSTRNSNQSSRINWGLHNTYTD